MTTRDRVHQARQDTYVGFWRLVTLVLVVGVALALFHACAG